MDVACARIGVACTCKGTARSVDTASTGMGVTCTWASAVLQQTWYGRQGSGPAGAHLPDTRLLAVHHRHVAGLVVFDELLLGLIELLGHEAHEGVVWGVSYSPAAEGGKMGLSNRHPSSSPGLPGWPRPGVPTECVGTASVGGLAWTRDCHKAQSREPTGLPGSQLVLG